LGEEKKEKLKAVKTTIVGECTSEALHVGNMPT